MSGIEFLLQDPPAQTRSTLDVLSQAAEGAESGGGIFAFASVKGIEMFLGEENLGRLARQRGFDLVVGVDSITNAAALAALTKAAVGRSKLSPRVLLHGTECLMHPKLCWFAQGSKLTVVVGSGNLTTGGLIDHFEACIAASLSGREALSARAQIDAFLQRWDDDLVAPDDPAAVERARRNTGSERSLLRRMQPAPELPAREVAITASAEVLVAEISKNRKRPTQLDVGKEAYNDYFGARPEGRHILIRPVDSSGAVGDAEKPRPLVETESGNYRFEAKAAARRKYPNAGKKVPIGVFVRMAGGNFHYRVIWPNEDGHAELEALLTDRRGAQEGPMRRDFFSVAELAAAWPGSPLLKEVRTA